MSSWQVVVDFFSTGFVPKGEYVYMVLILGLCVVALWAARKMVSDV
ncbi:MAG: hypothetical protein FWF07_00085 [Methanomassiliicoccaceae archaeon]|nr:hypothetical protein [Methanomassiliicoccaceae archaeon]